MKSLGFLCSLLLILFSCKKGTGNFTLEGTITDQSFSCPLTNAEVELYAISVGSNQISFVASMETDANGKYSFVFPRTKTEKYVLKVNKNQYFSIEKDIYYSELKLKEINVYNISSTAKSWVEIKILNTNPSSTDHMQFIRQTGKSGCSECCLGDVQHFYAAQNTSIYCINDGNSWYSIEYAVFGTTNSGIIGINTVPFDTTQLFLTY